MWGSGGSLALSLPGPTVSALGRITWQLSSVIQIRPAGVGACYITYNQVVLVSVSMVTIMFEKFIAERFGENTPE